MTNSYTNLAQDSRLIVTSVTGTGTAVTDTYRWGGGVGTIFAYSTSGTSGFNGGTISILHSPDSTLVAPYALKNRLGTTMAFTGNGSDTFELGKGVEIQAQLTTGANSNVTIEIWNARPSSLMGN